MVWKTAAVVFVFGTIFPACFGIEVSVGEDVTLTCSLVADFPSWEGPSTLVTPLTSAGGVVNQPGMEYVDKKNLKITNATTNHTGDYKCNDGNGEAMVHLDVNSFDVTIVLGDDSSQQVTFTYPRPNTTREEVTCVVSGAYPQPEVTLQFLYVTDVTSLAIQKTENATQQPDNTYTVSVTLSLIPKEIIENKQIQCIANFTQNAREKQETKSIYYRVPSPFVTATTVSPATWRDRRMNFTVSGRSRPQTTFEWGIPRPSEGRETYTYTITNPPCTMEDETLRFDCNSELAMTNVQKVDNGLILNCTHIYEGQPTKTEELEVVLYFPPTLAQISGNTTGVVSSSGTGKVTLTCSIDESNPAYIWWYKGSRTKPINSTYDMVYTPGLYHANKTSQMIDITVDRTMNGEKIICCGDFAGDICDSATLNVLYPPEIVAPQLTEYRVYAGDSLQIPCSVESNPHASIQWWRETDTRSNLTDVTQTDILMLTLIDVAGMHTYRCTAWPASETINEAVQKDVQVIAVEKPSIPNLWPQPIGTGSYYVDVETSATPPVVPRSFYVQYKKRGTNYWMELSQEIKDTIPGQSQKTERITFTDDMLVANTIYDVRVKSVDAHGLVLYSPSKIYSVGDTVQSQRLDQLERDISDTYTYEEYRNAILISIFATAGLFLVIIVIIVCCVRNGHCHSSSSKSYAM